jgi:hypothetical protein
MRKYTLYAIGEIALVVIGILIALSINNWNIDRQNKKAEQNYLQRIIQNLNSDLEEGDAIKKIRKFNEALAIFVLESLGAKTDHLKRHIFFKFISQEYLDTIGNLSTSFGQKLAQIRYYDEFNVTDDTFKELISSGKIDLISEDLIKESILNYYGFLENSLQLEKLKEMERNKFVNLLYSFGISMENQYSFQEINNKINNKPQLFTQIENLLNVNRSTYARTAAPYGNTITLKSQKLINQIEEYLGSI